MNRQFIPILKINKQGFTLIEVLVASVILFAAIAAVSMIYRGAFISSEKANAHMQITGVLPSTIANIQQYIRHSDQNNDTKNEQIIRQQYQTWDVNIQWQASLQQFISAPDRFDVDKGNTITPPVKYKLWLVDLTLEKNGLIKQYQFNELSWTND